MGSILETRGVTKMIIFPAIDIINGQCVRLTKGAFETAEKVAEDALETAKKFKDAGSPWIHMVDLDGAKNGGQPNKDLFIEIIKETGLKMELGGGIRDAQTAAVYLNSGVERIILGSAAVTNPKLIEELVKGYGDRIIVGIDAKCGIVKTSGWLEDTSKVYTELALEMQEIGVKHIVYTDIGQDGTLQGPNVTHLKTLKQMLDINVIASGGIRDIGHIKELHKMGLYGAICGKSIYSGTLDLKEALEVVK